jgi:hypothetical protein
MLSAQHSNRKKIVTLSTLASFAAILATLLLLAAGVARADTLYVSAGGSNHAALNAAQPGDTILVAAGTYQESLNWGDKDLTIQGAGPGKTVIDVNPDHGGPGGYSLYTWNLTSAARLEGVTLTEGTTLYGDDGYGDEVVTTYGNGMGNFNSSPTVVNCVFADNHLDDTGETGYGGGMYNNAGSSPTIRQCTFTGNTAYMGGGIYFESSHPTVTGCTFTGNTASFLGGGMANLFASATVTGCTFSGNSTSDTAGIGGGGMAIRSNNPTIITTLTNCTFTGNVTNTRLSSISGGAMLVIGTGPAITNCILWGNTAPNDPAGGGGIVVETGPGVPAPTVSYSDVQGGWPGTGNFDADPFFEDVAGGNYRLSAGSPCLNVGNSAAVTVPPFPTDASGNPLDLDGSPRISGPAVDLGAYEKFAYTWSGFLAPINADGTSVFKAGSTVSVKFQLTGTSAGITNAVATLTYWRVGTSSGAVNEAVSTSAADSGNTFRYDPTSKTYIFNWSTKGLMAGTYQLSVDLGDGITRTVTVGLR